MRNLNIYKYIGKVLIGYSILFLVPIIVSFIYHESFIPFLIPGLLSLVIGKLLNSLRVKKSSIYARDGFIIVALSWIIISLIGALPFVINKDLNYVDALFETVSGFTTTGATTFNDVEVLNKSILFWRSFTHFIGGMGVLTFVMAIIPLSKKDKSMHVLKAEIPGPQVGKLTPSIKKTLFYLYGIYLLLSFIEVILLLIGKMPLFDSIVITFGTAGTGGFSVLNTSIASYSVFSKYVIAIFMLLFGVNYNIYFLILIGNIKNALKSEELRVYLTIYVISVLFIVLNTYQMFNNLSEAFLSGIFHVSSIFTSTGYNIGDINIYPSDCRFLMLFLMIVSACAGSTCGGLKVGRLVLGYKIIKRELKKLVHPNSVQNIYYEGKKVSEDIVNSTTTFLLLYVVLLIAEIFIISFSGYDVETSINAVFSTFANVGLCFNISNYASFSWFPKIILSIGMLLGRLEIFPMLVILADLRKK